MIEIIKHAIVSLGLTIGTLLGLYHEPVAVAEPEFGATLDIAGATYTLSGGGISSSATSITLSSFTLPQNGYKIQDSDISDTFYITLEPGNRSRQEIVSCTTVTQNAAGTATLSGCTRGLSPITPYTASTTLQFAHSGGSQVIFSNPPQQQRQYPAKDRDESITGAWTVLYPTASSSPATKGYVDAIALGGATNIDRVIVAATAGETIVQGEILYFDTIQDEWMKADADIAASSTAVFLGVAQGAGTNGNAIAGGVLIHGLDTTNTGGTAGNIVYVSNTAGATSTSVGTITSAIGIIRSGAGFYFSPRFAEAALWAANVWGGQNTFTSSTTHSGTLGVTGAATFHGAVTGTDGNKFNLNLAPTTPPTTATTSIFGFTVPANTLSTGNYIRTKLYIKGARPNDGSCTSTYEVGYGNASTTFAFPNTAGVAGSMRIIGAAGTLEFMVAANGATNSQKVTSILSLGATTTPADGQAATSTVQHRTTTGSVDSTTAKNITMVVNGASGACYFEPDMVTTEIFTD